MKLYDHKKLRFIFQENKKRKKVLLFNAIFTPVTMVLSGILGFALSDSIEKAIIYLSIYYTVNLAVLFLYKKGMYWNFIFGLLFERKKNAEIDKPEPYFLLRFYNEKSFIGFGFYDGKKYCAFYETFEAHFRLLIEKDETWKYEQPKLSVKKLL